MPALYSLILLTLNLHLPTKNPEPSVFDERDDGPGVSSSSSCTIIGSGFEAEG